MSTAVSPLPQNSSQQQGNDPSVQRLEHIYNAPQAPDYTSLAANTFGKTDRPTNNIVPFPKKGTVTGYSEQIPKTNPEPSQSQTQTVPSPVLLSKLQELKNRPPVEPAFQSFFVPPEEINKPLKTLPDLNFETILPAGSITAPLGIGSYTENGSLKHKTEILNSKPLDSTARSEINEEKDVILGQPQFLLKEEPKELLLEKREDENRPMQYPILVSDATKGIFYRSAADFAKVVVERLKKLREKLKELTKKPDLSNMSKFEADILGAIHS